MLKIKNKRANVPNGYLYVQRETGFDISKVLPHTNSDFNAVCQAIRQHRLSNPQFKLNTNLAAIESELEQVTVARLVAMPGTESYLMEVGGAAPSFTPAPTVSLLSQARAAVGAIKTGRDVLLDWEESGKPPVAQDVADKRAVICTVCPQNGRGGLSRYFTIPAAELIKAKLERLHDTKLATASDDKINVCMACTCVLKLKVWTPIEFIVEHTPAEMMAKLDSKCWILEQKEAYGRTQIPAA